MAVNDGRLAQFAQQVRNWWRKAVAAVPPVALVAVHPHWTLARWVFAACAWICWTAFVALTRFIGDVVRVAGHKLIPARGERLANFIDHKMRDVVATIGKTNFAFGGRYRKLVQDLYSRPVLPSMLSTGFEALSLDDVFVDVNLANGPFSAIADSMIGSPPGAERDISDPIWRHLDSPEPVRLIILGVPGSGKTVLLRHFASSLANRRWKRRRAWPIMLRLRDCATARLRDCAAAIAEDPALTLPDAVVRNLKQNAKAPPTGWFEGKLERGRCVVMLDSLDDIVQDEARALVVRWLGKQIAEYRDNDYLVTSRPYGYQDERHRLSGAKALLLTGFTAAQRYDFVRRWYLAAERLRAGGGRDHREVREEAHEKADDLITRIGSNRALAPLAANPLLLTMMIDVDHHAGKLPQTRGALYKQIYKVLLALRIPDENFAEHLHRRKALLQALAFGMMQREMTFRATMPSNGYCK
jgi:NACHT domain